MTNRGGKYSGYKKTVGSRAEVWHGTAHHTSGKLEKKDLKQKIDGRIVSKKASARAKREDNLGRYGYSSLGKGQFGYFDENTGEEVLISPRRRRKSPRSRSPRRRSRSPRRKSPRSRSPRRKSPRRDLHTGHTHYRSGRGGNPHKHPPCR